MSWRRTGTMSGYEHGERDGNRDALLGHRSVIAWEGLREDAGSYTHEYSKDHRAAWKRVEEVGKIGSEKPRKAPQPSPASDSDQTVATILSELRQLTVVVAKLRRDPTWWELAILLLLIPLSGRVLLRWW